MAFQGKTSNLAGKCSIGKPITSILSNSIPLGRVGQIKAIKWVLAALVVQLAHHHFVYVLPSQGVVFDQLSSLTKY